MDHGGDITSAAHRYGIAPEIMLDLSTGISPRPWPVPAALLDPAGWTSLPQREDEDRLKDAARQAWSLDRDAAIAVAPGSQILISLLPVLRSGARVWIPDPAYSEHGNSWRNAGHDIMTYPAGNLPDQLDAASSPQVLIAVQPGNPLGETIPPAILAEQAARLAGTGGLVVVDEAFIDLMPDMSLAPFAGRPGLIVLRSFGKFFGLAGLRLGMAIGYAEDIAVLEQKLGPWATSTPALNIGAAALSDTSFAEDQRSFLAISGQRLRTMLDKYGLEVIGGTDLYSLAEVPEAGRLHEYLARKGIWTRIFSYAPQWIRFGLPGEAEAEQRLDAALSDWRQNSK